MTHTPNILFTCYTIDFAHVFLSTMTQRLVTFTITMTRERGETASQKSNECIN